MDEDMHFKFVPDRMSYVGEVGSLFVINRQEWDMVS